MQQKTRASSTLTRVHVALLALGLSLAVGLAAAAPAPAAAQEGSVDPALLAGLEARSIGPAGMSGRISALAGVSGDPPVLYVGSASGGLWRSVDGAVTWEPLFDDQPVASIGAIAVDPTAPEVLWVGTGEASPRNSASVGNGVYRSLDGGETWSHLGLEETEKVDEILLDPRDTDVAYVCALGSSWEGTEERGVYKTTDGGATFEKVLPGANPTTGCADLAMDPSNPNQLVAALWDHRRWPWFFRSGGPGSGLFVTHDGGESWREVTPEDGLPEGDLGRIGVAFAPSDPEVVYALVEAEENAFYASGDGGRTFEKRSTDDEIGNRPFYYSRIFVDPADPERIYSLWSVMSVSIDGGRSWETLVPFREAHPDHHALWIDPADPTFVVDGNDGGVYVSRDRGETWRFARNLPLAQYYHVRVDDAVPYNVYGGLQDNGSWKGPAEVWENGGIRTLHWDEVGFGDGFDTAPFPDDPMQGYAMSQEGYLVRWNLRTGERKDIRPAPPGSEEGPETGSGEEGEDGEAVELRFNWNAGFAQDPFEAATIYFGSQFVHRSTDRGETWEVISGDLTTDRPEWQRQAESGGLTPDATGAENFTSIIALEPSPVERGVLWAGTDDGRLHVTRDGGGTWTSVEGNVRGVPKHTWIPHVHASPHESGTAFVVFDDHRRFDWTPYVYRTDDYGASWTRLSTDDVRGYALSVVQDPVDPDLLFLGTEFGLWVSLDGGGDWMEWTHGVPTVSVMDLAFQEREADLVLGTHGRGIFVLDDVTPLRDLDPAALEAPLHLFPLSDAQQHEVAQTPASRFPGATEFRGENEPYGAFITFALAGAELPHPDEAVERERAEAERRERREAAAAEAAAAGAEERGEEAAAAEEEPEADEEGRPGDDRPMATIEIADASGEVVRTLEEPVTRGVNRVVWSLERDAFERPKTGEEVPFWARGGVEVPPGVYTVTVRYGDAEASDEVRILPDPRLESSEADRQAKYEALLEAGELRERLTASIERIRAARADMERIRAKAKEAQDDEEGEGEGAGAEAGAAGDGEGQGEGEGEEAGPYGELLKAAGELEEELDTLEAKLWTPPDTKGITAEDDPWSDVSYALRALGSSWDAPTPAQLRYLEIARNATDEATAEVDRVFAEEVADFKARVDEAGLGLLQGPPGAR
ncbi:MAG: hypothetical protein ACLF0P_04740 [Thermoanaerobaculia bacterium]